MVLREVPADAGFWAGEGVPEQAIKKQVTAMALKLTKLVCIGFRIFLI